MIFNRIDRQPYGHRLVASGDEFTSASEIGAATSIEFGPEGKLTAVAEPRRRGGDGPSCWSR